MNRQAILGLALACAALTLAACEEKKQPAPELPPPVEIHDDDVPTPADFDEEADLKITKANYKAAVDELEKEIDAK